MKPRFYIMPSDENTFCFVWWYLQNKVRYKTERQNKTLTFFTILAGEFAGLQSVGRVRVTNSRLGPGRTIAMGILACLK